MGSLPEKACMSICLRKPWQRARKLILARKTLLNNFRRALTISAEASTSWCSVVRGSERANPRKGERSSEALAWLAVCSRHYILSFHGDVLRWGCGSIAMKCLPPSQSHHSGHSCCRVRVRLSVRADISFLAINRLAVVSSMLRAS